MAHSASAGWCRRQAGEAISPELGRGSVGRMGPKFSWPWDLWLSMSGTSVFPGAPLRWGVTGLKSQG